MGKKVKVPDIRLNGRKRRSSATRGQPKRAKVGQQFRWITVKTPAPRPTEQVQVDDAGRIVIPAKFRRSLGLGPGDPVTVTMEGDVLRIRTIDASLEKARAIMRKKNPKKRSLVDELIADRREEAAKE